MIAATRRLLPFAVVLACTAKVPANVDAPPTAVPETIASPSEVLRRPSFWEEEPPPVATPTELDDPDGEQGWLVNLERGALLQLWPGGETVPTCEIEDVWVLALDGDRIRFGLGGLFVYTPEGSLAELSTSTTITTALLYSDAGIAYAELDAGIRLTRKPGRMFDGLVPVCVDAPDCTVRGHVREAALGRLFRRGFAKRPSVDVLESIRLPEGRTIALSDLQGRPLANVRPWADVRVLSHEGSRSEVLVQVERGIMTLHGYTPRATLEPAPPPKDARTVATIRGVVEQGATPDVHIEEGTWVFHEPDADARFARLQVAIYGLQLRPDPAPPEWMAIWLHTPWKTVPAFIQRADALATGPQRPLPYAVSPSSKELGCTVP